MIPKSAHPLAGVYAAALTPLNQDHDPDLAAIPELLSFLAKRGCHGALLLGTTGEGPSFSEEERLPGSQANPPGFSVARGNRNSQFTRNDSPYQGSLRPRLRGGGGAASLLLSPGWHRGTLWLVL